MKKTYLNLKMILATLPFVTTLSFQTSANVPQLDLGRCLNLSGEYAGTGEVTQLNLNLAITSGLLDVVKQGDLMSGYPIINMKGRRIVTCTENQLVIHDYYLDIDKGGPQPAGTGFQEVTTYRINTQTGILSFASSFQSYKTGKTTVVEAELKRIGEPMDSYKFYRKVESK